MAGRLFIFTFFVYVLTAAGHVQTVDVGQELAVAESMLSGRGFTIPDGTDSAVGLHGAHYSSHGIGESILLLPVVVVSDVAPKAYSHRLSSFGTSLLNPLATALTAALLSIFLVDIGFAFGPSALTALIFSFASIAWPYAHSPFDVTPVAFFLLLSLFALHRYRIRARRHWLVASGCAIGFCILIRLASVVFLPFLLAYLLTSPGLTVDRRKLTASVVAWAVPVGSSLGMVAFYDWIRFGSPWQTGYSGSFSTPLIKGLLGLLVSPGKSLLLFSPVIVLSLWGFSSFWKSHRTLAYVIIGLALANIVFYARWFDWSGDWAWGPRFMVPLTPLLLVPAACVLSKWSSLRLASRIFVLSLIAGGVFVQLLGVALDYQVQMQLQFDAGTLYRYWQPEYSQVVIHATALWHVITGSAPYPASRIPLDKVTGRPSLTTWDFWWVYAWLSGIGRRVVLLVVSAATMGAALSGFSVLVQMRTYAADKRV